MLSYVLRVTFFARAPGRELKRAPERERELQRESSRERAPERERALERERLNFVQWKRLPIQ